MESFEHQKRKLPYRDYDRKNPKYRENDSSTIEHAIKNIGESDSVIKDLERFVDIVDNEILHHRNVIFNSIYKLSFQRPEMIPTYVTLIGMLHVKESEFGSDFLFYITDKINSHFQTQDYRELKYLIRFVCDLVNVNMVSVKCVLDLFEKMMVTAQDESTTLVYRNWLLYTIIISIPWMASKADTSSEFGQQFDQFMRDLTIFYDEYNKNIYKPFRIWSVTSSMFLQEDYIMCAWGNMQKLKNDDWRWVGVTRPYDSIRELKKAIKLALPNIMLPSSSEMFNMPLPNVVIQIFTKEDVEDDKLCGNEILISGSQNRNQLEEQIEAILLTYEYDRKECASKLVSLTKFTKYAIPYIIVEFLFQNVLNISSSSISDIYCCVVLCLLCRSSMDVYPIIINKIVNILINKCDAMNVVCVQKFANFFSHYIANNTGNWNWDELEYIIDLDINDTRKIFLIETFNKLQNHYGGKFKMDEQFSSFNHLLEFDRDCNYYYGAKTKCPETLIEIKKQFVNKIIAKASCDDLYNLLDVLLNDYNGEAPFQLENTSTKTIIHIHLTIQTLLAAHRYILSKTFNMIDSHKLLLQRLIHNEQHEIILLYSVYQFWFKYPLRIKIIFFYLCNNDVVSPASIIRFLLQDKFIAHLNKFYVWEIIDELLDYYRQNDINLHQKPRKVTGDIPRKRQNRFPRIKMSNSDEISSDPASNSEDSNDDLSNGRISFGDKRAKNLEVFQGLLYVFFERLCHLIAQLDIQCNRNGSTQLSKLYFNTSQFFQNILLKNCFWFSYISNDLKTLFETHNYFNVENLATIYSRFVTVTS